MNTICHVCFVGDIHTYTHAYTSSLALNIVPVK